MQRTTVLLLSLAVLLGARQLGSAQPREVSPVRGLGALVGEPAPDFDLPRVQGSGTGKLAELRGQVVLIEFWATYCGWCRSTHPKLARLAKRHRGKLTVLGISSQGRKRLTRYLAKHSLGFTALWDRRRRLARRYAVRSSPTIVLVDRAGVVRYAGVGVGAVKRAMALVDRMVSTPQ